MYTIADLFDLSKTAAAPLFQGKTYPWEVLGEIKIVERLPLLVIKRDGSRQAFDRMKLIGGEQSGHIIFHKYANTGDGLLTAIKVMQVMLERKCSLSELVKDLKIYPQVLKNAKVTDKDAALNCSEA